MASNHLSYHGTNESGAKSICGPPIDIKIGIGKGELGKGFYTSSSISLAASWAYERYKDGHVVEVVISADEFVKLIPHVIRTPEKVIDVWSKLRKDKTTASFEFGYDYVVAPLATIREIGHQFKFESDKAEETLNKAQITVFPCV